MGKASAATLTSTPKSDLIDGLKVVEPEALEETGECVGGKYFFYDSMVQALPLLRHWAHYNVKPVALDLETGTWEKGGDPDPFRSPIYLMACSTKRGESHVFDIRALLYEDEARFREAMAKFLAANTFICHNGQFEQAFLMAQFGVLPHVEFDTMLVSQILTAGLQEEGNGLDDCFERHLHLSLPKDDRKFFIQIHPSSPLTNKSIAYAAGDVAQLKELASILSRELSEKGLTHIWEEIEKPFLPILTKAKLAGVTIDVPLLETIREELEQNVEQLVARFGQLVGSRTFTKGVRKPVEVTEHNISITSWQQLMEWYYGMGHEIEGTGEEVLAALLKSRVSRRVREFTETVLEYRRVSKVLGTYALPLLSKHQNRITQRVHPDWKQMVDTGRMACRNPNLQNIPSKGEWSKLRECFIARPGHKLIVADYSQMELRILAQLSQEPGMLSAFRDGEDLHAKTAEALFGEGWTKEQRGLAKTINFGIAYGAGPNTLAEAADIPIRQAQVLLQKYFKTYPKLKEYLEKSAQRAKDLCYAETPAGRKRWFTRPKPDAENYRQQMGAIGREGCNMPIQGCNADATKIASALFADYLCDEPDVQILMWVHDEIVVEAAGGVAEMASDALKSCMIEAGKRYLPDVPVEVTISISDRWEK
jgi:DNA polymerase-1